MKFTTNIPAIIFTLLFSSAKMVAQTISEDPINIIEVGSEEKINIDIPDNIRQLLIQNKRGDNKSLKSGINKMAGYRIQVFSDGSNPHTLESRAKSRGNTILSKFPKYKGQVYTYSSSPNWYTRIGNFRTISEANSALNELKKAFPALASEMRVVKSQIVIIK